MRMRTEINEKKCLPILSNLYLVTLFVSQILSYRFVNIGGILTVASVFVIPFTYSFSDLIAEQYGYDVIRQTIWRTLIILLFASILLYIAQELPAKPTFDHYTNSYYSIFHPILRIYFSNLVGIVMGMFLNSYIIVKWRKLVNGKIFFIRSLCSSIAGEFIFTSVVVTLVQFGVSGWHDIREMIFISFSIKVCFTFISALIAAFAKPLIQYYDGYDTFSNTTDYNPFKFGANGPTLHEAQEVSFS